MAMRLVADAGLWSTAARMSPGPLVALLEVSGAVLSWTIDEPAANAPQITFTDPRRADWLWQVFGESGHLAVAAALDGPAPDDGQPAVDLAGVGLLPESTERLRRLAVGHWLRRWWPASQRDGVASLDPALLDAEIAVLTAAAQDFFSDDTLDSDSGDLLAPHPAALTAHLRGGDHRIVDLVRRGADLAEELGFDGAGWQHLYAAVDDSRQSQLGAIAPPTGRRADYALAAGPEPGNRGPGVIAGGVGSVRWSAVPAGIFDAAENTVDWVVEVIDARVVATVRVTTSGSGPASGIGVQLRSDGVSGAGVVDAGGRVTLRLVDTQRQQPITEAAAWNHHWPTTTVTIGVDSPGAGESPEIRERIRRFARLRLQRPAIDAYLAEIVAAESDY